MLTLVSCHEGRVNGCTSVFIVHQSFHMLIISCSVLTTSAFSFEHNPVKKHRHELQFMLPSQNLTAINMSGPRVTALSSSLEQRRLNHAVTIQDLRRKQVKCSDNIKPKFRLLIKEMELLQDELYISKDKSRMEHDQGLIDHFDHRKPFSIYVRGFTQQAMISGRRERSSNATRRNAAKLQFLLQIATRRSLLRC